MDNCQDKERYYENSSDFCEDNSKCETLKQEEAKTKIKDEDQTHEDKTRSNNNYSDFLLDDTNDETLKPKAETKRRDEDPIQGDHNKNNLNSKENYELYRKSQPVKNLSDKEDLKTRITVDTIKKGQSKNKQRPKSITEKIEIFENIRRSEHKDKRREKEDIISRVPGKGNKTREFYEEYGERPKQKQGEEDAQNEITIEDAVQKDENRCHLSITNDRGVIEQFETIKQQEGVNLKREEGDPVQENTIVEETHTVTYDRQKSTVNAKMIEKECIHERVLERLNLRQFYPNKLKLMDVMAVKDCTNPLEMDTIALHVAMKIIMINYTARDELLLQLLKENEKPNYESSLDNLLGCDNDDDDEFDDSISINPLDLLLTIFKCSSPMLQQVLADKLFKCKLAIPFVHPTFDRETDLLTLWPLRSIIIECKTENGSLDYNSVDCPCHVVSFIRLGRPSVSKSKLINEILSDQYHNTFFNKDCSLGTSNRVVSEGMVEISWYLPSKNSPCFDNVTMFLNLRGDGKLFNITSHTLSQISNVVVVLLHIDELSEDKSNEYIGSLVTTNSKICLAVDAGMYKGQEIKSKIGSYFQQFKDLKQQPNAVIVAMNGQMRSISAVKRDLRKTISDLTNESDLKEMKLSERVKQYKGNIDEQKEIYVNAEHAAREIIITKRQTELETAVSQLFTGLRYEINLAVEKHIQELDEFINQNSLKDVMMQWVQHKRIRLKDNADICESEC